MAEIGHAYLAVLPSAKGFGGELSRQVNPQMTTAGGVGGTAFGGGMLASAKKFAAPLAGLFAATAVIGFFKDAAAAAIEDEKSVVALAKAMDNLGLSAQTNGMEKFARDTMLATGTADDLIRNGLQKLVTATGDVAEAQKLMSLSMDISAGTGKDLVSVSQALARASLGNLGALQRLGIPLDANIIKTKDFAAATDVLSQKFGGQAAAAADTYGGRIKIMSAAVDEAKETIGYALLNALDGASDAFGGEGGLTDGITLAGEAAAGLVTGIGGVITGLAELAAATKDANAEDDGMSGLVQTLIDVSAVAAAMAGPFGTPITILRELTFAGLRTNQALKEATEGFNGLYGGAARGEQSLARAAINLEGIRDGASGAAMSVEDMTDAVKDFQAAISLSQSMDDFREDLRNIGADLKGSATTIFGPAGKDVRDKAREIFGQIPTIVQQMVDEGKIAQGEFGATIDTMSRQALRSFAKNKVNRKDIEGWLGEQGIWSDPAKERVRQVAIDTVAAAVKAGTDIGADLGRGIPVGLLSQTKAVQASAMRLIALAEQAARDAARSKSPSLLFAAVGEDLVGGLIIGMGSKKDKVAQAATDMMQGLADKAGDMVDNWDEKLDGLKGVLEEAQSNVATWAQDMRENLLSGFDIGAAYEAAIGKDGKLSAANWIAGVDAQIAQMEWFGNVLNAIRANGGVNGQLLMDYLASKGAAVGGAMGQSLIDNGLVQTMADKLGLVQANADAMADSMVPPFLTAGVAQAQSMYDGFFANFGAGGPARVALENLMDRIAKSLDRTSTITIRTVYEAAGLPGRANGGPVLAGQAYTVGERGEETFVPGVNGTILPHGSLDMASAATRSAAVAATSTAPGAGMAVLIASVDALRKEVRDQAERDRTMVRSNGYR